MKFSAGLLNIALALGLIGMAGTADGLNVPLKEKVQARVEARLAELKGSELVARKPDYCSQCLSCGPNCDACCCCYGGCNGVNC